VANPTAPGNATDAAIAALSVGIPTDFPQDRRSVAGDVVITATNLGLNSAGLAASAIALTVIAGGPTDLASQAATTSTTNKSTLQTNLASRLSTVETWITNNPTGAVLTAAQTKVLMQGIAGLIRLLLNQTATIGGA